MNLTHEEAVASLLDNPAPMSAEELQEEVAALLGDDDPLAVALVIEEAERRRTAKAETTARVEATLEPCRLETPCGGNEPIAGNGRCMTCGAQRANEAPAASDTEAAETPPSAAPPADAPIQPDTAFIASRAPPADDDRPISARVKAALGLTDKELGGLLGVARPTAQAYACGRLPEIIDGVRAEYMRRAVRKRLEALAALDRELDAIIAVSD